MPIEQVSPESIIDAAARHLPQANIIHTTEVAGYPAQLLVAVPTSQKLEKLDLEHLAPNPRRLKAHAQVHNLDSFLAYLRRHADDRTVCWVNLNPLSSELLLTGQIDEHANAEPSWRDHKVTYKPMLSVEWNRWQKHDCQKFTQIEFALWIEDNRADIASAPDMPTGAEMLEMALQFEARQDMRLKSHTRLQSGGVQLEYVATDDDATINRMKMFDRFTIGIPVFWGGERWSIEARLRYRVAAGAVTFWYELVRPDRVHEAAARDMVAKLEAALADDSMEQSIQLLMGQL